MMDEHILNLFSQLLIMPHQKARLNTELTDLYKNPNSLCKFFVIAKQSKEKDLRFLAAIGIRKALENNKNWITEFDNLNILKAAFLSIFTIEREFEILKMIIQSAKLIFPFWPEIFDFINHLIQNKEDQSLQLAMLLLAEIPEELISQFTEIYVEMCKNLIEISLQEQTNLLSALFLFSSISKIASTSTIFSSAFSSFFSLFLFAFQQNLLDNDSCVYTIADHLIESLKFVKFADSTPIMSLLLELTQNGQIEPQNNIAIFNIINALLKSQTNPIYFEPLLEISLNVCASLFDQECYIENKASSLSFKFLKSFSKCGDFDDVLLKHLKCQKNELIFASLSAIFTALPYISNIESFVSFILPCCEAPSHSISELAFSILIEVEKFDDFSYSTICSIYSVVLKTLITSANHHELLSIILHLLIQLLYNTSIPPTFFEPTFTCLINLYQYENAAPVRDRVMIGFAALINGFDSEIVESSLPQFVPFIIESLNSPTIECLSLQRAAVETLSICISNYPQHFTENVDQFFLLLLSWISNTNDREHIESALFSFKMLLNLPNMNNMDFLAQIFEIILKYLNTENDEYYDLIDDSCITFEQIQLDCLSFIRRLINSFSKNNIVFTEEFINSIFSDVVQTICPFVLKNEIVQKSAMKTILAICKYFYNKSPHIILPFYHYFISIFETNWEISNVFFTNIFDLYIQLDLPSDFLASLLTLSFQQLIQNNFDILPILASIANRFEEFPIVEFHQIVQANIETLKPEEVGNVISVYYKYILNNFLTEDKLPLINDIMKLSFKALKLCTTFSIPPNPIRIFSILSQNSIKFNDQTISQFYPIFIEIFNTESQSEFFQSTIYESILFLLIIIVLFPEIHFPFDSFFPKLFDLLPPSLKFRPNSELYMYITKLPTSPHFSKMAPYFGSLFGALIRTIALDDYELANIGIDSRIASNIFHFAFQIYRNNGSNDGFIKTILQGDLKKIDIITNRFGL